MVVKEKGLKGVNEELLALQEISTSIQETLELNDVLQKVADGIVRILGFNVSVILLKDREGDLGRVVALSSEAGLVKKIERILECRFTDIQFPAARDYSESVQKVLDGQVVVSESLHELARPTLSKTVCLALQRAGDVKTFIVVPLSAKGEIIGAILASSPRVGISEKERGSLISFANQAALAVENSRLFQETRRSLSDLSILNKVSQAISSTLNLGEICDLVVKTVASAMVAKICTIRFVEGDELTVGTAFGYSDEEARGHRIPIDERLAEIVRDKRSFVVEDLWADAGLPKSRWQRMKKEGVRSFLGVPIISLGKTTAILSVYKEVPHAFGKGDIRLLSTIANQVAVALENARLYQEVMDSEKKYETLVEQSNDAIYILQEGKFVYINPTFEELLGYSLTETSAVGFDFMKLVAPKSQDLIKARMEKSARGKTVPLRYEFKGLTKDGREIDFDVSITHIDYQDKPATQGILRDITERKKMEQRLVESEKKYRALVENVPNVIYRDEPDGRTFYMSPYIEKMIGYRPEDFYGDQELWWKVIHPDDQAGVRGKLDRMLKTGEEFRWEYRMRHRNRKDIIWTYDRAVAVRDEKGNILYFEGILQDITDRKIAEEELKRLNEELTKKIDALETFKKVTVDRELKMIELKKRIKELEGGG